MPYFTRIEEMDWVGFEPTISAAAAFSKDVNLQPVVAQRHDAINGLG
jgi:hypothetical protein